MQQQYSAASQDSSIAVVTTDRGLPTALKIDRSELRRAPQELANEILALCQLSAMRAQLGYRQELVASGFDGSVIAALGLPSEQDVAGAERDLFGDVDEYAAPVEGIDAE